MTVTHASSSFPLPETFKTQPTNQTEQFNTPRELLGGGVIGRESRGCCTKVGYINPLGM